VTAATVAVVATSVGSAEVRVRGPRRPAGLLALGHGAGGDVDAADLQAVAEAAAMLGWRVALVTQPYRVAGRRSPPPAARLDAAWREVLAGLGRASGVPLVVGGRSSGARVACRTAADVGAAGVVALAFPWRPPGKTETRYAEISAVGVPLLAVQGERDPFGGPDQLAKGLPKRATLHPVPGADHSFRARKADRRTPAECAAEVGEAVGSWLRSTFPG
jgi:predicted alpha/beta-hydrolase family hydrolase